MFKIFNDKSKVNKSLYKVLYTTYKEKIYKIAFSILKNEYDAKDVLQDTFIKVIENIDKLNDKNKFENWIVAIAYNTAKTKYNENRRELLIDDNNYMNFLSKDMNVNIPEEIFEKKEFSRFVMQQIKGLNNQYSEVISLYYYSRLTYQEISECLGVNIGTVKSRLNRAKQILKEKLNTAEDSQLRDKSEVIVYEEQRRIR